MNDDDTRSPLLQDVERRAARYLSQVGMRPVAPTPEALSALSRLAFPLPEQPRAPGEVLALLDDLGSPATVATTGPRYFGFVTGGTLPAALAASWLANAWDQNAMLAISSPVAAKLEEVALGWLREVLALPEEVAGAFVTGATMSSFTCLAAARHAVLARAGWDVETRGLFGAPEVTVVVGAEAHATIFKALGLLGFGRERVVRVPADAQGRMRADAFPRDLRGPAIVCLQAGNVNSGAFDRAEEIIPLAHEAGAWVHVDGAFGLWAAAAPGLAHLLRGYAAADSWTTDGHKWLNVPYDSGLAFVRDGAALTAAMAMGTPAPYLVEGTSREPSHFTPDSSRRARGIEVWAALASLGRAGVADLVARCCWYAQRLAEGLAAAGYEVLNEVVLNQVLVAFGDDATTRAVIAGIQEDGTCWCGGTVWHGRAAMRISVSSWATTAEDVERSLAAMLVVAGRLAHQ